jgi:hypothetical protein
MSSTLAARTPGLEWAHQAAANELEGLAWVDTRLDPDLVPMRQSRAARQKTQFRHQPYMRYLPPVVVEAALEAQAQGTVSGWEVLMMLFARMEWTIRGRRYLWAPYSPIPRLLATLVETYGVEVGIHQNDPERLGRLTALLPVWHPHRGSVSRARELLALCDAEEDLAGAISADGDSGGQPAARLQDEVFACHDLAWWSHRATGEADSEYRISAGFLRFQPTDANAFALRREDVLIHWTPGRPLPHHAVRLLPAWMVVRLAAPTGRN